MPKSGHPIILTTETVPITRQKFLYPLGSRGNGPWRKWFFVIAGFIVVALVVTAIRGYQVKQERKKIVVSGVARQELDSTQLHKDFPATFPFAGSQGTVLHNFILSTNQGEDHI